MLHTWKGLKSRARTGPECFSVCPMTGSLFEVKMWCTLYIVRTPLSPPPMITPEDSGDPFPKFPQISLWNLKKEENKAGIGHDFWWKARHPPHYQNSHPCFNLSNISISRHFKQSSPFEQDCGSCMQKKEISFLPKTFKGNLKRKRLSLFFWLFHCLFKTFRTSHGIWWVKSSSLHFTEN